MNEMMKSPGFVTGFLAANAVQVAVIITLLVIKSALNLP
jgi:hypothetical protein